MNEVLFLLHACTLALVWFLVLNAIATLGVAIVATRLRQQDRTRPPAFWLGLRLFPSVVSLALIAFVFFPSYWKYEPRDYAEGFGFAIATVALAAFALAVAGIARGAAAWRRASRRATAWLRMARPVALPGTSMPAFEIDADAPIVALVGIFRPRLFITRSVVAALTDEELAASVAHELGHRRAFDNLQRLAMRAAPDFPATTSLARNLERRWASAAEQQADRRACETAEAAGHAGARCALASAIIKVARMVPPVAPSTEPISTLVDGGDIESRVHSLLDTAAPIARPRARHRLIAAAVAAATLALWYAPLLKAVHFATEVLVHTLP
jgi:hypothetical protein